MPSQNVFALAVGVAAAEVPAGQAVQSDTPVAYVSAAHSIAKAESTMDKAKTAPRTTPAVTRVLKDFMTTYGRPRQIS